MRCSILFWILMLVVFSLPAHAHPHAWISVRTTIIMNAEGQALAIREHWLFDKMYSSYAVQDFNPHKNGAFSEKDLLPLAQQNVSNLKDYNYFTVIEDKDGQSIRLKDAKNIGSNFEIAPLHEKKKINSQGAGVDQPAGGKSSSGLKQIAMDFTLPLSAPINLRKQGAVYRIYDPTYYTDINHYDQNSVIFLNEENGEIIKNCSAKIELPKIDQHMLFSVAALDKKATAPQDLGYYFSEKVTLACAQ